MSKHTVFLPFVGKDTILTPPDYIEPEPEPEPIEPEPEPVEPEPEPPKVETGLLVPAEKYLHDQAFRIFELMRDHAEQCREELIVHDTVLHVAQFRVHYIKTTGYVSHTDKDGYGPDYFLRLAGYSLPSWYSEEDEANSVESLAYGHIDAEHAWDEFMQSPGHRAHLMARQSDYSKCSDNWKNQTRVGIGQTIMPNGRYVFVIITVHPQGFIARPRN